VIIAEQQMTVVTRERALRSLITHGFAPNVGYIDYGAPMTVPPGRRPLPGNECLPAKGTAADGSYHMLKVGDQQPMVFVWVARERAWGRMGGHRLAFTPDYLGVNGWSYVRPATPHDMATDLQRGNAIQFRKSIMQNAQPNGRFG
jgi:hypothetical protein